MLRTEKKSHRKIALRRKSVWWWKRRKRLCFVAFFFPLAAHFSHYVFCMTNHACRRAHEPILWKSTTEKVEHQQTVCSLFFGFTLVSCVERQEQTDKNRKSIVVVARKNLGKTIREKLNLMLSNGSFADKKRAKCEMNTIPLRIARSYKVSLSISHTFTYIKWYSII